MYSLLCILVAAFGTCVLLTPLAKLLAVRCGLLDQPDGRRKMHACPVPLAGGIAIMAAVCLVLGFGLAISDELRAQFAEHATHLWGLLLAALAICSLGVLDDFQFLRGRHKLLGQIVGVGILIGFGIRIHNVHLFGEEIELGILAVPVTLLWLLGAINSLNLIDGMDGLLSSVGFIITSAIAAIACLQGHWAAAFVAAALAGALLGFLCFNFPPASVFLGDAGSMLVGLVVGVLGIESSVKAPATVALVAPVAILTIPFFDTLAALVRRKLTGRSIYTTDRGHIHHCLLRRGLSTRVTLLLISSLCLVTVLGALASLAAHSELIAVIVALAVIMMLVATRLFGHAEFTLFRKRLYHLAGSFLDAPGTGKSRRLEIHFQGNTSWSDLLQAVADQAMELNLMAVRVEVNAPAIHEHYHGQWHCSEEEPDGATFWRADLPVTVDNKTVGRLAISGMNDREPLIDKIAMVVKVIEEFQTAVAVTAATVVVPASAALDADSMHEALALQPPHVARDRRKAKAGKPAADDTPLPVHMPIGENLS